jgi:hypothetical protein
LFPRCGHQSIERRPPFVRAGNPVVDVLHCLPPHGEGPEGYELILRCLLGGRKRERTGPPSSSSPRLGRPELGP